MKTYYRYTNKNSPNSPMSDWGHAMLAEDERKVEFYGENKYTYDGSGAVHISELRDEIIETWDSDREDEFYSCCDFAGFGYEDIPGEEIYENFNPSDIVDDAGGFDNDEVQWLWERILAPKGIMAVITYDGAVVFDEDLIKKGVKGR